MKTGLATEEMQPCPSCDTLTFETGPCFSCSAKGKKGTEDLTVFQKAAAYEQIMAAENAKPWGATELIGMMHFANGFVKAWLDRPGDQSLEDHWVTFSEDIDIQFWTWDPDDEVNGKDESIHATGYRRTLRNAETGERSCTDEVRLI